MRSILKNELLICLRKISRKQNDRSFLKISFWFFKTIRSFLLFKLLFRKTIHKPNRFNRFQKLLDSFEIIP